MAGLLSVKNTISGESDDFAEVTPMEAESAVIEQEFDTDANEMIAENDSVEVAVSDVEDLGNDVDQLEGIESALEPVVADETHAGLDELGAEALSLVVKGIRNNSGFNVDSVADLVSTESYGPAVGGRRQRTVVAYEGVVDAVKSGWAKVVEVIKSIIDYLKEFWDKHFSTVGRLRATIKKLIAKVKQTKGHSEMDGEMNAAGYLKAAFPGETQIGVTQINEAMATTKASLTASVNMINAAAADASTLAGTVDKIIVDANAAENNAKSTATQLSAAVTKTEADNAAFGTKDKPMFGGVYGTFKTSTDTKGAEIEMEWLEVTAKSGKDTSINWTPGELAGLQAMLKEADVVLEMTTRVGQVTTKANKDFNTALSRFTQAISKSVNSQTSAAGRKALNIQTRRLRDVVKFVPKVSAKLTGIAIRGAGVAVKFTNASLATYKVA